jgi:heptaprenyl diphosphate synthase
LKKKVAYFGVFTALALIFSYIESLIPINFGIPGAKLGLANLMVVIVLYKMGAKEAYMLSMVRIVLSGFLFGNLFGILYSLAGGILSLSIMTLLKQTDKFSIIGISMAGAVFHNMGQLIIAGIVVESANVIYYMPALLIVGLATGLVIGIISSETIKRLRKI